MRNVYIDFETYSPEPIKTAGAYRYTENPDFEILLIGYAVEDEEPKIIDLVNLDDPQPFFSLIQQPDVLIHAHNAAFERLCLRAYGCPVLRIPRITRKGISSHASGRRKAGHRQRIDKDILRSAEGRITYLSGKISAEMGRVQDLPQIRRIV